LAKTKNIRKEKFEILPFLEILLSCRFSKFIKAVTFKQQKKSYSKFIKAVTFKT